MISRLAVIYYKSYSDSHALFLEPQPCESEPVSDMNHSDPVVKVTKIKRKINTIFAKLKYKNALIPGITLSHKSLHAFSK